MQPDQTRLPSLNHTEWLAVAVAINDAAKDYWIWTPPRTGVGAKLRELYTHLTGNAPLPRLANPRLDILHRFVNETRRHRRIAEPLVPDMIAQGFNRAQVEAIALLSS
jgi:hypothetical protein